MYMPKKLIAANNLMACLQMFWEVWENTTQRSKQNIEGADNDKVNYTAWSKHNCESALKHQRLLL